MAREHDPFDLATQQRDRAEAERREQLAKHNEAEDFKWLMKHKQGRRFVWRLLERAGMYRTSFTGNSETFFREGMRNFGILLTVLAHDNCAEQYALMVAENREQKETKNGN